MAAPKPKRGETKAQYQQRLRADGYDSAFIYAAVSDYSFDSSGGYGCASSSSYSDSGSSGGDSGGCGGGE